MAESLGELPVGAFSSLGPRVDTRIPLGGIIEAIEQSFGVKASEILDFEWPVMLCLGFDLHPPNEHVLPHLQRILSERGTTLTDYLGYHWSENIDSTEAMSSASSVSSQ